MESRLAAVRLTSVPVHILSSQSRIHEISETLDWNQLGAYRVWLEPYISRLSLTVKSQITAGLVKPGGLDVRGEISMLIARMMHR